MNKPRYLPEIVDQLLEFIPEVEEYTSLKQQLKSLATSASYSPPEDQGRWWRHVAQVLYHSIGEPKEDWQIKLANLFNGKET